MSFDPVTYAILSRRLLAVESALSDIEPGFAFKGVVAVVSDLPASGNESGDLWIVTEDGNAQYVWTGTRWLALRGGVKIATDQIDALFNLRR